MTVFCRLSIIWSPRWFQAYLVVLCLEKNTIWSGLVVPYFNTFFLITWLTTNFPKLWFPGQFIRNRNLIVIIFLIDRPFAGRTIGICFSITLFVIFLVWPIGKKTNDPCNYIFHVMQSVTKMTEFRFIKYKCKIICFLEICQSYFRCGQRLEYKHRKKCVLEMFTITIHRHEQLTALETTSLRPPDNFVCFCIRFHRLILTARHR